jgi:hypothetical protein
MSESNLKAYSVWFAMQEAEIQRRFAIEVRTNHRGRIILKN